MTMVKHSRIDIAYQLLNTEMTVAEQVTHLQQLHLTDITGEEIATIADMVLQQSQCFEQADKNMIDIVGTGGDGANTFNISTISAFIISACGYSVAKHGNRAITSRCGSFDCLTALGIALPTTIAQAQTQLNNNNICFLYAPYFHPQFKKIAIARQQLAALKQKTIFNILGPLLNPANVDAIVIGVYQPQLITPMIEACRLLNKTRAIVLHGDGTDEASISGPTQIAELKAQTIEYSTLNASDYQLEGKHDDLIGGDSQTNADIASALLKNQIQGSQRNSVIFNAALAINLLDDNLDFSQAIHQVESALNNGDTARLLKNLQEQSS